ncbi:MAG: NAD(P)-binding domain-containing protein [Microbacteriaceae bacterium]
MTHIGFIGLGIMGLPMAANLVEAGHTVRGFSRTAATRDAAAERGIQAADSARDAASGAEIVITMLPDSPDVLAVCLGDGAEGDDGRGADSGIADALDDGAVLIDMSTIDPAASRRLHAALGERGIPALDAPVSGGEQAAIDGTLSIMVGGDPAVLERVRPVLDVLGATVVHVGETGSGQVVKAANQLMVAIHLQALAEATVFLEKHDADVEAALRVISGGLAGSTVLQRKTAAVLNRTFDPGFRLALHHKDLGIVQSSAREHDVALPATALVSQFVQALVARGDGHLDHSALYALAAGLSGDDVSASSARGDAEGTR